MILVSMTSPGLGSLVNLYIKQSLIITMTRTEVSYFCHGDMYSKLNKFQFLLNGVFRVLGSSCKKSGAQIKYFSRIYLFGAMFTFRKGVYIK